MLPIILAIRDDDDRIFVERIYEAYREKLLLTANKILKNEEDAEDCVHETVVILINSLEKFRTFDEKMQVKYLVRCCRNISINKYKKNKYTKENVTLSDFTYDGTDNFDFADVSPTPSELAITKENATRIAGLIEELRPIYSEVLFFSLFAHMSNTEIAKALGISENLVGVRLYRAKKELLGTKGDELDDIRRK